MTLPKASADYAVERIYLEEDYLEEELPQLNAGQIVFLIIVGVIWILMVRPIFWAWNKLSTCTQVSPPK